MLERYRAKAAAAGLPPPPVLRADATRLPFRDACVDAVLEVHVLHLVPDWERALAEARRVLAPGGVLLHAGGGAYERGSGSPRDQVIGRFDELAGDGDGPPRVVGADLPGRCWSAWSPWAGGSRSWSRSSGRSRRPTPRRCAGSRSRVFSYHVAPARRGLADRRRPGPGRGRGRPSRPGHPASGRHRSGLTAVRF